ncbi:MAG: hypothetical protein HZR80_20985 [Candidatus Heimdallarchaeota archaeon]
MTIFRCTSCSLRLEIDDSKDEIIEGPCAPCIEEEFEKISFSGTIEVVHIASEEFI